MSHEKPIEKFPQSTNSFQNGFLKLAEEVVQNTV